MSMALFAPPSSTPHLAHKSHLSLKPKRTHFLFLAPKSTTDNGAGIATSAASAIVEDAKKLEVKVPEASEPVAVVGSNGAAAAAAVKSEGEVDAVTGFSNPKWVNGTWDLNQFQKDGATDWDAVIDAEVKRRKWLEVTPESSSNDNPVVFDTSIIPWWAWMKRFHLPEAELLNGRAAMIGFFMAYFVDSLTGVGLVDQMGNFFCKTLLFVAVVGVLLVRKNEDFDNLKKLIEETTFYDKQWQATWKDDTDTPSTK